jgi:hypothetical protein
VVWDPQSDETDIVVQIKRLTDPREFLRLGELRGRPADTIRRCWSDSVTDKVILTGERRAHYLARHPEMEEYERHLPDTLFDPDEIHKNARDPRIGIWFRHLEMDRYLRAVVWISDKEDLRNSVHSFQLADKREVRQGHKRGRLLWAK